MSFEKHAENRESAINAKEGDVFMTPGDFRIEVKSRVGDVLGVSVTYVGNFPNVTVRGAIGDVLSERMTINQLIQLINS